MGQGPIVLYQRSVPQWEIGEIHQETEPGMHKNESCPIIHMNTLHRENVCCARARLHVEPLPVDTYRTRFTRVPVRSMYGPVCYRIGILYHGMPRKHGRRSTRK